MSAHTCVQEPTEQGRIIPQCEGCYETVEAETAFLNGRVWNERWQKRMSDSIYARFNPLNIADQDAMIQAWKDGRWLMDEVAKIAKDCEAIAMRDFRIARKPEPQKGGVGYD